MYSKLVSFITIVIMCLPISSPVFQGGQATFNEAIAEKSLKFTMASSNYSFNESGDEKTIILMEGFDYVIAPGLPMLPVKTYLIGIPKGGVLKSIEIINESHGTLQGSYEIIEASQIGSDLNFDISNNYKKIISEDSFPEKPYEFCGTGNLGPYQIAIIRYYPFLYSINSKTLTFYNEINIRMIYEISENEIQESKSNIVIEDDASKIIDNYKSISQINQQSSTLNLDEQYPYIILTTTPLENSVQFLKNWRELTLEIPVKIINVSWIESNYEGNDISFKIRSFLQEKYIEWGLEYVLIVGSNNYIPMRACYPDKEDHSSKTKTLTDFYYADLTGNWDADNDGYYGERDDDSPDFFPEIYVGRLPFDDPGQVKDTCQKIIDYEQDAGQWKNNALLLGAILYFYNEDNNYGTKRTDGSILMEVLKNDLFQPNKYSVTTMYEKEGINPSSYSCTAPLNQENVNTYWSNGYGIVTWNSHGNKFSSIRKYWNNDDGDLIPELNELLKPPFISSNDAISLENEKPSIVFSCSCSNAFPENSFNLGASLLNNGAVAFVGSTGISWTSEGWNNRGDGGIQTIDYDFFDYLLNWEYPFGKSLYYSLQRYSTHYDWWGWKTYQNLYDFCLYGDPACSLSTYETYSSPNTPDAPTGPSLGKANTETTFFTNVVDIDGHDIYVQWDWGDGKNSNWIGPFSSGSTIYTNHRWTEPGIYDIKVKAQDFIGSESEWSQKITIQISSPKISIDRIKGGLGKVKAVIENTGEITVSNVEWNIDVDGIIIHSSTNGVVETLSPNESVTVESDTIFGFGFPKISVQLPGLDKEKIASCILLGPFIIAF